MRLPGVISPLAVIGGLPEHRDHEEHAVAYHPRIGSGTRINAFVTVDSGTARHTTIGENCFLLAKSHVGHDSLIGDRCELATGAVLGGWVELGDDVKVGLNAVIRPRVKVGAGARIGAGAVVVKDVPAGETWIGSPARPISEVKLENETMRMWLRQSCTNCDNDKQEKRLYQGGTEEVHLPSLAPPVRGEVLGEGEQEGAERLLELDGVSSAEGLRDDRSGRSERREEAGSPDLLRNALGQDDPAGDAGMPSLRQPVVCEPGASLPGDLRRQHGGYASQEPGEGTPETPEGYGIDPLWIEWYLNRARKRRT